MSLAKKALSPEVEARVQAALRQTNWEATYPKLTDRITAWRAAKEVITARVLAEVKAEQVAEALRRAR
jgi:hypothetical protein